MLNRHPALNHCSFPLHLPSPQHAPWLPCRGVCGQGLLSCIEPSSRCLSCPVCRGYSIRVVSAPDSEDPPAFSVQFFIKGLGGRAMRESIAKPRAWKDLEERQGWTASPFLNSCCFLRSSAKKVAQKQSYVVTPLAQAPPRNGLCCKRCRPLVSVLTCPMTSMQQ